MIESLQQVVDPTISQAKFEKEISLYRKLEAEYQRQGWWLLEAKFPTVFVVFATPQLKPPAVICGALLDFTNYDFEPPSVKLVDPFSRVPYKASELPTALLRGQIRTVPGFAAGGAPAAQLMAAVPLMQSHDPNAEPFMCVPGVREYHNHPAHSADPWLNHRGLGEGTLINILSVIYRYGVQPISEYDVGMKVTGFQQGQPPL